MWTSADEQEIKNYDIKNIPKLVHDHYPNMKLIVSLRDPVDRAISAYYHLIRDRRISPKSRIMDVAHKYGIINMGFYHIHLQRWMNFFPSNQFLILVFEEDIIHEKKETIINIYRFLGVDENYIPNDISHKKNPKLGPLYRNIIYCFPWIKYIKKVFPNIKSGQLPFQSAFSSQNVSQKEINELQHIYAEKNQQLESFLGRSLPWSC